MVAVLHPCHPDLPRQLVIFDLAAVTETVTCTLHDERRGAQRFQMFEPGARRLARWMKGIAEADQAAHLGLIGHHTCDASPQRFPADGELPAATQAGNHLSPRVKQHRLSIRRRAATTLASRAHVGELKPHDAQIIAGQRMRDSSHERRIHRRASSMSEHERQRRAGSAVDQQFVAIHFLTALLFSNPLAPELDHLRLVALGVVIDHQCTFPFAGCSR
jgi:hypothetical protein